MCGSDSPAFFIFTTSSLVSIEIFIILKENTKSELGREKSCRKEKHKSELEGQRKTHFKHFAKEIH
jgi:hypothetical protein